MHVFVNYLGCAPHHAVSLGAEKAAPGTPEAENFPGGSEGPLLARVQAFAFELPRDRWLVVNRES